MSSSYVFESDEALTKTHLGALDGAFDEVSTQRLAERGVGTGWKCWDIGAGSGSIARWLSGRVGDTGEVLATDVDLRVLQHAQGGNLTVREHDLTRDEVPEATYDLIHARLVLILLDDKPTLLDHVIRALKPGGVVVFEDFDVTGSGALSAPESSDAAVFDRVLDAYLAEMTAVGADVHWGRNVYAALRNRGLNDVRSVVHGEAWQGGSPGCELLRANFTQLRERILSTGSVSQTEWERAVELLGDQRFAMRSFLMATNSGIRPE